MSSAESVIMDQSRIPGGAHVSYRPQFRRCGKPDCPVCVSGARGHGPYWYAFWRENGRKRSLYLGKNPPPSHQARPNAPLRVRTLGGFAVWRGAASLEAERWQAKVTALCTCLLAAPEYRLTRDQVIESLWPEAAPGAGAHRLRSTLHVLRRALDHPGDAASHVRLDGGSLVLDPAPGATPPDDWLDAAVFARAATRALAGHDAAACRAALAACGGEYLPNDRYADWTIRAREELRRLRLRLLLHLAAIHADQGRDDEAVDPLQQLLADDACHEEAARLLLRVLGRGGRRTEVTRTYQQLVTNLHEELALAPSPETRAAYLDALGDSLPSQARTTNLPAPLTSFIGRQQEMEAVSALLGSHRLVTLWGSGGCGKTRLALQVAGGLSGRYQDGVWLVELAALREGKLIVDAVVATLNVRAECFPAPHRSQQVALVETLRARELLLILDNCEHLRAPCADLAVMLLRACPHLRLLVTSRQPLGVQGERVWPIPGLALPTADPLPALVELTTAEAVLLFAERARAAQPAFQLTDETAPLVARICRCLDGLPLAIELAAARLNVLALADLAARLDDRFQLLDGGNQGDHRRHQSLRATMDWSYGLLPETERTVLRRLTVFAGAWTLEAAEMVCADGVELLHTAVLPALLALVEKSLVFVASLAGRRRYGLLETVRQYAAEQLSATEREGACDRHLQWYDALVTAAETGLAGSEQAVWLDRLALEYENLRMAMTWSADERCPIPSRAEQGLVMASGLLRYWMTRGGTSEGRHWLEALLARAPDAPPALSAKAHNSLASLTLREADYQRARNGYEQALALWRRIDDRKGVASALSNLGLIQEMLGDLEGAMALQRESLAVWRVLDDITGTARSLANLGVIALRRGDLQQALAYTRESLAIFETLGELDCIAVLLGNLGAMAREQGDLKEAEAFCERSIAVYRQLKDRGGVGRQLHNLGQLAYLAGDYDRAVALHQEALRIAEACGDRPGVAAWIWSHDRRLVWEVIPRTVTPVGLTHPARQPANRSSGSRVGTIAG